MGYFFMSENNMYSQTQGTGLNGPCPVPAKQQIPLSHSNFPNTTSIALPNPAFKIPVLIAEHPFKSCWNPQLILLLRQQKSKE